jgi:dihydropteroate synthase
MFTLNLNGQVRCFHRPAVMGILNVNDDSFHAGSRVHTVEESLERAGRMVREGADMLDVGGQSTRPGSIRVSAEEEASRAVPVIRALSQAFPSLPISVDTYHALVAERAVEAGAVMVNDVSAGILDATMIPAVARLRVPYVCMHMQGTPESMQDAPSYGNVLSEVFDFLAERLAACRRAGIHDLIADPGFGFGKTVDHNFRILGSLGLFRSLGAPLMVGLSRKSMIWKTLGVTAEDALNGSTVLHSFALVNGADILRVHDVREAAEAVRLFEMTFASRSAVVSP